MGGEIFENREQSGRQGCYTDVNNQVKKEMDNSKTQIRVKFLKNQKGGNQSPHGSVDLCKDEELRQKV